MKITTFIFAVLLCFSLTACGGFKSEDAATLVQGNLDSVYLNVHSPAYLELCETTEEECIAEYETCLNEEADSFFAEAEIDKNLIDEETYDRYVNFFGDIYKQAKYEVGEVTKADDTFLVSVTVYPVDLSAIVSADFYNTITEELIEQYSNGGSEEELNKSFLILLIDEFEKLADSVTYLDPVTLSVQVVPETDDDGESYYIIDENDFNTIANNVVYYEQY
ncbi:MAG TPA: hypothetical protein PKD52_02185 [Clostridiales bacterium]|nr:hypothetical protein [Clostridiales bacterium]